ncbi:MAG: Phosphohistidine phosphatase SixA [Nitrosopumilales archaeon]|nr:MAG: Phosphohistidine phosphatase SixA [Nitrosopumilales archaeon]
MKVYLVQHAKPKPEEEDPQKPLSEQGRADAQKVAEFAKNIKVNKIQHSGKLRAQQTAEILGKLLGVEVVKADSLEPMADTQIWANRLEEQSEDVMLVGHLPHLAKLASQLLTQNQEKPVISFKQGGIVCLEKTERGWQVAWMVTPDLL